MRKMTGKLEANSDDYSATHHFFFSILFLFLFWVAKSTLTHTHILRDADTRREIGDAGLAMCVRSWNVLLNIENIIINISTWYWHIAKINGYCLYCVYDGEIVRFLCLFPSLAHDLRAFRSSKPLLFSAVARIFLSLVLFAHFYYAICLVARAKQLFEMSVRLYERETECDYIQYECIEK